MDEWYGSFLQQDQEFKAKEGKPKDGELVSKRFLIIQLPIQTRSNNRDRKITKTFLLSLITGGSPKIGVTT